MRGVLYFLAGSKHCAHAIVSVASLRKFYDGPVVFATEADGPGRQCAEWIARDDALNIPGGPIVIMPDARLGAGGHGKSYFSKTFLPKVSPLDATLFLDADTLVVDELDELWPEEGSPEVTLTQFVDWVSTGGKMSQRIKPWGESSKESGYVPDAQQVERVYVQLRKPWPAINTGVMAWTQAARAFTDEWHRVTAMRDVFIVDETACQIIFPEYPHRVLDDRFNASTVFAPAGQTVEGRQNVRIWHGHGGKFWKRPTGWKIYRDHLFEALDQNRANIQAMPVTPKWLNAAYNDKDGGQKAIPEEDRNRLLQYGWR
jgi:hypothetical protein